MSPKRRSPAVLVVLCGIVAALHIGKMPPAIPVLGEALGVTLVQAGFLLSMVQLAGMLAGVLVGVAADSVGLRRSVLLGLALLALASFTGVWVERPFQLLFLRGLEGLGFLLVVLPSPSLIRRLVPPSRLSLYLGLWGTYMATGTSLALVGWPLAMTVVGWQGWWVLLALATLAMLALAAWRIPADTPCSPERTAPIAPTQAWWQRLHLTLSRRGPWLVALAFAMYSSQWLAVIGFLPAIYAQAGIGGQLAGLLTAGACLANVTGNIAAGRLLHSGFKAHHLMYFAFVTMGICTFLAFGELVGNAPVLRYVAVVLFSSIGGLIPGALFSMAVHVAPNEHTVSTTVGWMQQCSSTGQFIGPPLVAWLAASTGGWQWTWLLTGAASLTGLLLASKLREPPPR